MKKINSQNSLTTVEFTSPMTNLGAWGSALTYIYFTKELRMCQT